MNLILSDRTLDVLNDLPPATQWIDLSRLKIANCVGCFGCWTKTPGRCVIRDDAVKVYPCIAASDRILYVSRIRYGGYDSIMKTMLERSIPVQQAFIRLLHNETHHVQRSVVPKDAIILGYGDISPREQALFRTLAERNGRNMNFERFRVVFAREDQVEAAVSQEVAAWQRS